jgi:hypothetical protein
VRACCPGSVMVHRESGQKLNMLAHAAGHAPLAQHALALMTAKVSSKHRIHSLPGLITSIRPTQVQTVATAMWTSDSLQPRNCYCVSGSDLAACRLLHARDVGKLYIYHTLGSSSHISQAAVEPAPCGAGLANDRDGQGLYALCCSFVRHCIDTAASYHVIGDHACDCLCAPVSPHAALV